MFREYIIGLLNSIPLWVYVVALCVFIGGSVISFVIRGKNQGKKLSAWLFLLVYVILMLCSTIIFRETKTTMLHGLHPFWHYEAFSQGRLQLLPELVMNVVVFIPLGFVFCLVFRRIRWWQAAITGMGLSVGIELLQLIFKRGCADIDDVIHNTLGCLIGYGLYVVVSRCLSHGKGVHNANEMTTN